jgi:hypothetical protein
MVTDPTYGTHCYQTLKKAHASDKQEEERWFRFCLSGELFF